MYQSIILFFMLTFLHAQDKSSIIILGNAQDAGAPQAMCQKDCCKERWIKGIRFYATSLALVHPKSKSFYLFDCTPDFKYQMQHMIDHYPDYKLKGIFLTHAHVGHYAGLIHLGREIVGAKEIPVYAMPKMSAFLKSNGPWSQLVTLRNIKLMNMLDKQTQKLELDLDVTPFRVPHRDEYSETVGYTIKMNGKKVTFIPDINKWDIWEESIVDVVKSSDLSIIDGSFYDEDELPGRNMSEIPHPFIQESMALFHELNLKEKNKIMFIHFNHTNPLLNVGAIEYNLTLSKGFQVAKFGDIISF